jgi:hypothetical protein
MTTQGRRAKRLLLIELNELNFDVAREYVQRKGLRHLERLMRRHAIRTSSEQRYEKLEPWIQWVSAHTGLTADEHGVFRLGDIVGSRVPQLFEELEASGLRVGCVSAMNAENRLAAPAYFIPDPWTRTPSDGSYWSRSLAHAIGQAVNDNAQGRISGRSKLALLLSLLRFAQRRHWPLYARLGFGSRGKPWRKALFLDLLLHDVHAALMRRRRPDFSTLFLNAGAHIQHHYFFNARAGQPAALANPAWYVAPQEDPFGEMLEVYDAILADYIDLPDTDLIVATGLTQQPYDRVKFYYRLRDHADFLRRLGVPMRTVQPRMTRDFLVEFDTPEQAREGERLLRAVHEAGSGTPIFEDIDNRGDSLFVTLTWPREVTPDLEVRHEGGVLALHPHVAFVAIKNGMHRADGYAFFGAGSALHAPPDGAHVSRLYHAIRGFFGLAEGASRPVG